MARKSGSSAVQEELYPHGSDSSEHQARERQAATRELFDDARLVDLETEQESPFLRGQKRVSVRRGSLPKKTATRLLLVLAALAALAILGAAGMGLYRYGERSWRFRIDSSDQMEVSGAEHVSHAQIMEVMGGDIGRNIFFVPLAQRQRQLEQIPWVESASVMRFVPNRLRIVIQERTPVAFVRIGSHISLIDAGGTLMEPAPAGKHKYSFPVIAGMNAGEPLSTRAARMKNYNQLVRELDSGGAHYSQELSEVDLSDPEDVKVLSSDANGEVLVHLGSENYLQRYKTFVTHAQQWRQQFEKLDSVDLRYDGQIIVNPDLAGMARQPALTPAAAKAAMAVGVKTAAIVNYEKYATHPAAAPAKPAKKDAKLKTKSATKPAVRRSSIQSRTTKPAAARTIPVKVAPVQPNAAQQNRAQTNSAKQSSAKQESAKTSSAPAAAVKQAGLKENDIPAAKSANAPKNAPKNAPAVQPVAPAPTAVGAGQKKPNAGIPKETPPN